MNAMQKTTTSSSMQLGVLILVWALLFGTLVRIMSVISSTFPVNDGGLFYSMSQDIIASGFKLPLYASYNHAYIPFVYPPLGLYILGFLSQFLPGLQLVRWLPVIYSSFSVLAFFLLARSVFKNLLNASLATLAFAMIPSSADILVWGGGVTRALGYLFCLLALEQLLELFQTGEWKYLLGAVLFSTIVVLSHPSVAFMTVLFASYPSNVLWDVTAVGCSLH